MNSLLLFLAGSNLGIAGLRYEQTGEIASNFYAGVFALLVVLIYEVIEGWQK